jgi:LysM repeat protein
MSERPTKGSPEEDPEADQERRCPACDSVASPGDDRCLMCGNPLPVLAEPVRPARRLATEKLSRLRIGKRFTKRVAAPAAAVHATAREQEPSRSDEGEERRRPEGAALPGAEAAVIEAVMRERRSSGLIWLTLFFAAVIGLASYALLRYPVDPAVALFPTASPPAPTITQTPTWTPLPSSTSEPSATPTITPVPVPTDTPQPPRFHTVTAGETLFGLSLRYGVTADSIAEMNGFAANAGIQVSQQLAIPWPTPTPPLVPVQIEIGGELVVADPTDCLFHEISSGDTLLGIAARYRVDLEAILEVNRLTTQSILQPGDSVCIPDVVRGGVLRPTPGPSPTPTVTQPPPGPVLLYPVNNALIDPPEGPVVLQWSAVKHLADDEWYMVELTDLSDVDDHPKRGFARHTSLVLPSSWRPAVPEVHQMSWRVSIVRVTGERSDGSFIYTFGGNASQPDTFYWMGAEPTPTPAPTLTATPESVP